MTTLREAATQALAALELVTDLTNHDDEIYDAIDTLRAALVEEALQRFTDVNQELEAALAEPAQEPVAHKHEWFSTGAMEPGKMRCIHCGIWNQENAPPQRKPLTREEAIALWADKSDGPSNGEIVSFARAIERAHGIGGSDD